MVTHNIAEMVDSGRAVKGRVNRLRYDIKGVWFTGSGKGLRQGHKIAGRWRLRYNRGTTPCDFVSTMLCSNASSGAQHKAYYIVQNTVLKRVRGWYIDRMPEPSDFS